MLTTEWNAEQAKKVWEQEAREEGREEGIDVSAEIMRALIEKTPIEDIASRYQISIGKIKQLQSVLSLYSS